MRHGQCPRCHRQEVYRLRTSGQKAHVWIGGSLDTPITFFLCAHCGYLESYVLNEADLQKAKQHGYWVQPDPPHEVE